MSATSEQSPAPDRQDALSPAPTPASERAEPRLAASEKPLPRTPRTDALRPVPTPGDRLETAMSEFARRQLGPEAVPEAADFKRAAKRRVLLAATMGIAGTVGIASIGALLLVSFFPTGKDAIQSFAAALPAATSRSPFSNDVSNGPLPRSRTLVAEDDRGESFTHEQSERLLQQFVQWREQIALTEKH